MGGNVDSILRLTADLSGFWITSTSSVMCSPNSADRRHGRFCRIACAISAGPRQKSTRLPLLTNRPVGFRANGYLRWMCHPPPDHGIARSQDSSHFWKGFNPRSIAPSQRLAGMCLTYTGHASSRTSLAKITPSSPTIVMDLSLGPTILQVTRATMFSEYSMQPTEKSGAIRSTGIPLSGIWHDENAVTWFAGPKKAASHVKMYPACSNVHPTSNSSLAGQGTPASLRHSQGAAFADIIPSSKLA